MPKIRQLYQILLEHPWPEYIAIEREELAPEDVFVLAAGFEDRARSLVDLVRVRAPSTHQKPTIVVVDYKPVVRENKPRSYINKLRARGFSIKRITYDRSDPGEFGYNLERMFSGIAGRLVLGVAGMSRLLIVQALAAAYRARGSFEHVDVVYTEAAEYPPDRKTVYEALEEEVASADSMTRFLSSGVFDICIPRDLSSIAMQGEPVNLVAFPSFNPAQLTALIVELQPAYITMIHGVPPKKENGWRQEAIARLNDLSTRKFVKTQACSTFDYRETIKCLLQDYKDASSHRRIIWAPTGSKMQSVAMGVLRAYLTDVQVAYTAPQQFESPREYTVGVSGHFRLALERIDIADNE